MKPRTILSLCFCVFLFGSFVSVGNLLPAQTATLRAGQNTKAALRYLQTLKHQQNNRILLGQDLGHGNSIRSTYPKYVTALRKQTSRSLGLIGGDYGLDDNHDVAASNKIFIEHWKRGGLVTISWHLDNPWTGRDSWDTNGQENLDDLISGRLAARWKSQLDEIANALKPLQRAGVPVLFRPLHEANGDWFWWGQKKNKPNHEAAYKRLFQNMHHYLTETRGLNNLLWVYSAAVTHGEGVANYYPGPEYVDVVGIDIYDDQVRGQDIDSRGKVYPGAYESHLDDLIALGTRNGHPVGITEFGRTPASATDGQYNYQQFIDALRNRKEIVLAYAWHNYRGRGPLMQRHAIISNQGQRKTMHDPLTITLTDIPLSK